MISLYPRYTLEDNSAYDFKTGTDTLKYKTTIVIDELNDDLLLNQDLSISEWTSCTCQDYGIRKRHCKHILECKDLLKQFKINFREVENEQAKQK
jgi:hypothetical protein